MSRQHLIKVSRARCAQSGIALIEALIAMLLIALWMLATAGLQINSFKFQKSAGNRFQAVVLTGELSELMEANRGGANAGAYALASTSMPVSASSDCAATYCSPAQLAAFDLAQWSGRVALALPLNQLSVVSGVGPGGLVSYTITISWNETRGSQTYATSGTTETLSYVMTKVVRNGV